MLKVHPEQKVLPPEQLCAQDSSGGDPSLSQSWPEPQPRKPSAGLAHLGMNAYSAPGSARHLAALWRNCVPPRTRFSLHSASPSYLHSCLHCSSTLPLSSGGENVALSLHERQCGGENVALSHHERQ